MSSPIENAHPMIVYALQEEDMKNVLSKYPFFTYVEDLGSFYLSIDINPDVSLICISNSRKSLSVEVSTSANDWMFHLDSGNVGGHFYCNRIDFPDDFYFQLLDHNIEVYNACIDMEAIKRLWTVNQIRNAE